VGTAPLVESRTSEAVGAAAARRDSRNREARDGRETAAKEGNDVVRRGGRCGSEVESAVAVAMEAGLVRQRRSCGRALSPLILVFQRESHRRIWAVRLAQRFERKGIKMHTQKLYLDYGYIADRKK
jgi:hypothetical protein